MHYCVLASDVTQHSRTNQKLAYNCFITEDLQFRSEQYLYKKSGSGSDIPDPDFCKVECAITICLSNSSHYDPLHIHFTTSYNLQNINTRFNSNRDIYNPHLLG
jgi:hypothetical protein